MKCLLIYPPQWYPVGPYLSVPLLVGQLKKGGFDATAYDLNVEFFNDVFTKTHLDKMVCNAWLLLEELTLEIRENSYTEEKFTGYPVEIKSVLVKQKMISDYLFHKSDTIQMVRDSLDEAVKTLKTKELFYNPELLFQAKQILNEALNIISLPYSPSRISMDNYFANFLYKLDFENVRAQCYNRSQNMFIEYFESKIDEIISEEYDFIGISFPDLSQLIPGLTLARMLKEKTNTHISLGGNYIIQTADSIKKYPAFFSEFCDSVLVGDGETSIVELARYVKGEIPIEQVPSLVFKNSEGKIISNGCSHKLNMDNLAYADFDDYDMSKYFSPNPLIPIQLSKGCYWGKCNFCDYHFGQQSYEIKSIDRVIKELKFMTEKYKASHFIIVDEAIPPKYYNDLATKIIESGLTIFFYSFSRLEKDFTKEVLQNLYHAGARLFLWGYESHSERIMKLMNKGIDVKERLNILRHSHEAGIWNNGLFIFGYPTETKDEIQKTMDIIRSNRDIINSCTLSNFSLKKNAMLVKEAEKYGITAIKEGGEFYTVYDDVTKGISKKDRRAIRRDFQQEFSEENAKALWPVIFSDFDHLLLYLSFYSCDWVGNYHAKKDYIYPF